VILVDPAVWPWRGRRWAHLASDESYGELHDFAARLGLRRLAFQGDHYDVDEPGRGRAVRAGARAVDARRLVGELRAAGLRRRRPRAALRWTVVGEWPLDQLDGLGPDGWAGSLPGLEGPELSMLPVGALAELVRAGRALPDPAVVLRVMARSGEVAAVLAGAGCELPLPLPEVVVERSGIGLHR
jgi:hypothetical protein